MGNMSVTVFVDVRVSLFTQTTNCTAMYLV